jgi:hypothetical protein
MAEGCAANDWLGGFLIMKRLIATLLTIGLAAASLHTFALGQGPGAQPQPKQSPSRGPQRAMPTQKRPSAPAHSPQQSTTTPARTPRYGAAIGGQGGKPARGAKTIDVRDYGAATTLSDNATRIQAAYDASLALVGSSVLNGFQNPYPVVVHIPSGTWNVSSPIFIDGGASGLAGETGAASVIAMTGVNGFPLLFGIKRTTKWNPACVYAAMNPVFHTDHRMDLLGKLDTSIVYQPNMRWGLTSKSPTSGASAADHNIVVFGGPPAVCGSAGAGGATGVDYWRGQRKFTLEMAFENPSGTMANMNICGMGPDPAFPITWSLTSNSTQFVFRFTTQEGTLGAGNSPRQFSFGDATQTGLYRIWLQIDFTANDGSGLCAVTAAQGKGVKGAVTQRAVKRAAGTQNALQRFQIAPNATGGTYVLTGVRPDTNMKTSQTVAYNASTATFQAALDAIYGAGNTTNVSGGANPIWFMSGALTNLTVPMPTVDDTNLAGHTPGTVQQFGEPGFSAANDLHFNPNFLDPFWFFGPVAGGANGQMDTLNASTLSAFNLYGFQLSDGWVYTDQLPGNPEHRVDGQTNNDNLRYNNLGSNNLISVLLLIDPPHNSNVTCDKLVRFRNGPAGGNSGDMWGFFFPATRDPNGVQCDLLISTNNWICEDINTTCVTNAAGGGVLFINPLTSTFRRNRFSGGFYGMVVSGGFNNTFDDTTGVLGSGCANLIMSTYGKQTGNFNLPIGDCLYRFTGSWWNADQVSILLSGQYWANHNTECIIRVHGNGGYATPEGYFLGAIGTDFELTSGPPILHFTLGGAFPTVRMRDCISANLGQANMLQPNSGFFAVVDGANGSRAGRLFLTNCNTSTAGGTTPGLLVACDGPQCDITVTDCADGVETENFRYTGPGGGGPAFPLNARRRSWRGLPVAGRFVAGTQIFDVPNPASGAVSQYVCTTSGTVQFNPAATYQSGWFVRGGDGNEYTAKVFVPAGKAPPNATYWTPTGLAPPQAVFKANATVGP